MEKTNMATAVIMPRQGQSVESCIITEWKKKVGDKVSVGDVLFSYETDKSAFDEAATAEGTLLKVFAAEGDDVPCLETVCIIGNEGEDISSLIPKKEENSAAPADAPAEEKKEEAPVKVSEEATGTATAEGGRLKISPRARNLAAKTDADISKAVPTGPSGRIIERDVQKVLDAGLTVSAETSEKLLRGEKVIFAEPKAEEFHIPAAAPEAKTGYTDEKLSQIRKVISKSMHTSLTELAQLTLTTSFDASALVALRASLKTGGEAVCLIKPQFEAGREKVGKKGVVRELSTHIEVVENIRQFVLESGFSVLNLDFSPIKGPQGNIEYLIYIKNDGKSEDNVALSVEEIVKSSHCRLGGTK